YHPRPCARRKRRRSGALLGPDDAAWLEERGLERVPRERGALDAHRELAHPRKDRQLSERLGVDRLARRRRQNGLEAVEQLEGLGHAALPHGLGHQRGRCLRNRTAAPREADITDDAV